MTDVFCLHTADIHTATFDQLFANAGPGVSISHSVRADWLAEARAFGLTPKLKSAVAQALSAAARSHRAVLCTCSTLGPLVDVARATAPNIVRIDRALLTAAAAIQGTVVIAYCLESTREPTAALFKSVCRDTGSETHARLLHCAVAWPHFERGDTAGFAAAIVQAVRDELKTNGKPQSIVLAQASMAVAGAALANLAIPVLASPEIAVRATISALRGGKKLQPQT